MLHDSFSMGTTVTLDPDVEKLVRRCMRERGLSFNEAINWAIRAGIGSARDTPAQTPTRRMGEGAIALEKALRLAGELEDENLARRLATRE